MVNANGEWDWLHFGNCLPPNLVLRIAAIKPPSVSCLDGVPAWCWDPLHAFSVRSAYRTLASCDSAREDKRWSLIASFKGSPRVRTFLWLAYWDRILTNCERMRRTLTNDASYLSCGASLEDTLHVLRDCPVAVRIWSMVVKPELLDEFFSLTLRDWLSLNLEWNCRFPRNAEHWDIMFGVVIAWFRRLSPIRCSARMLLPLSSRAGCSVVYGVGARLILAGLRAILMVLFRL
ncbi:hypothetical protein V6N13_121040 [Hibiscus sabdariffa]